MDPRLPQVRALSVAGDTIAGGVDVREGGADAVGHERVDLEGRCVLPAFCDAHVHFLDWALARTELDLRVDLGGHNRPRRPDGPAHRLRGTRHRR